MSALMRWMRSLFKTDPAPVPDAECTDCYGIGYDAGGFQCVCTRQGNPDTEIANGSGVAP